MTEKYSDNFIGDVTDDMIEKYSNNCTDDETDYETKNILINVLMIGLMMWLKNILIISTLMKL